MFRRLKLSRDDDDQSSQANLLNMYRTILNNRPVKRALEDEQDGVEAAAGQDGVRMARSENKFLQIQGLDNHLAHMSRPRLDKSRLLPHQARLTDQECRSLYLRGTIWKKWLLGSVFNTKLNCKDLPNSLFFI